MAGVVIVLIAAAPWPGVRVVIVVIVVGVARTRVVLVVVGVAGAGVVGLACAGAARVVDVLGFVARSADVDAVASASRPATTRSSRTSRSDSPSWAKATRRASASSAPRM
jgi:hypothetical protein